MSSRPRPLPTASAGTAERALDISERLAQTRGFNGFSYADVAGELQITKASLHYHFPGKAELGTQLIERYATRFIAELARIDRDLSGARAKLEAYVAIYRSVLERGRSCLCGVLAAESETLPAAMRDAVSAFFETNGAWVTDVFIEGASDGSLRVPGSPQDAAWMVIDALEGAILLARVSGGMSRFDASAAVLLGTLTAEPG